MTATAVCSATADPPTVLVCVNRVTTTHRAIADARHVLRQRAAPRGPRAVGPVQRRAEGATSASAPSTGRRLATGAPVLLNALVSFDCRVVNSLDARHAHHLPRRGRAAADRQEGQAACSIPTASTPSSPRSRTANRCPKAWTTGASSWNRRRRSRLWELYWGFLSIGARSFGGVLPWAHRVMVEERRWLAPADFAEVLALCQFLPGPNVGNVSVVLGRRWFGLPGAIVAFLGLMALPLVWVFGLALLYAGFFLRSRRCGPSSPASASRAAACSSAPRSSSPSRWRASPGARARRGLLRRARARPRVAVRGAAGGARCSAGSPRAAGLALMLQTRALFRAAVAGVGRRHPARSCRRCSAWWSDVQGWMSAAEFTQLFAIAQAAPGPERAGHGADRLEGRRHRGRHGGAGRVLRARRGARLFDRRILGPHARRALAQGVPARAACRSRVGFIVSGGYVLATPRRPRLAERAASRAPAPRRSTPPGSTRCGSSPRAACSAIFLF